MKKSPARGRPVLMAGVLLGLVAGMGAAVPASASTEASSPVIVASQVEEEEFDREATLNLRVNRDGELIIRGQDFEARRVNVELVNQRGRVVFQDRVRAVRGDFRIELTEDDIRCDQRLRARASSQQDDRVRSRTVFFPCPEEEDEEENGQIERPL